jgi:hypothetical protein
LPQEIAVGIDLLKPWHKLSLPAHKYQDAISGNNIIAIGSLMQ